MSTLAEHGFPANTECEYCDKTATEIENGYPVCGTCGEPEPETTHKPICAEYWDRGLNCPCIPPEENKRIASALNRGESIDDIIDPGWGQYD